MKKLLSFILFSTLFLNVQCQDLPSCVFDREVLKECLVPYENFKPVPQAKDSFWQNTLPQSMVRDYIQLGYGYKGKSWNPIPESVFGEFRANGNRANYERLSFGLRKQMVCLVMAEIMEHKGILMEDIIKGLDYFKKEIWWGVSAHYPQNKPDPNNQVVDLFNAETANMLAWTIYMLHDELEGIKPGICEIIKKEIDRRFLLPARTIDYRWKNITGNHNPWICANWLSCVLLCETEREQQIKDINQILTSLEFFIAGYPLDGGCDEGVHYWDRAAASLYECVRLIELATSGMLTLKDNPKFKAMGSFVYKSYICDNNYVNFADTPSNTNVHVNILFPFGHYICDSLMTGYAAMLAKESDFNQKPTRLFLHSGNYPTLSRELLFLKDYSIFEDCEPAEPVIRDTWLPNLQFYTARSFDNSTDGLFIAAKGGHNAENHNHNDVGTFIIYDGKHPLFIDLGFATYTAQTFSNKRYELMNNRSAYHNVPLINGYEQHDGKDFCANNVEYRQDDSNVIFSLNLDRAYPKDAEIIKWKRTIKMKRGKRIEITEDYALYQYKGPTEINLIVYGVPEINKKGRVSITDDKIEHFISFNSKQLTPVFEKLNTDDIGAWRDKTIYRIILKVNGNKKNGKIKYTIQ